MKNHLHYETTFAAKGAPSRRKESEPFRVLLIGDFSGRRWQRARGEVRPLRRPVAVDVEHFEHAMGAFQPRLLDGDGVLELTSLDSFHPDTLFAQMSVFEALRRIRSNLQSGGSIEQAMVDVKNWLQEPASAGVEPPAPTAPANRGASEDTSSLLGRLLGGTPPQHRSPAEAVVAAHLQELVRPYLAAPADPRRQSLQQSLDDVLSATMRVQLARADFCELEAAWRGAHWVASSLDTNEEIQIFLFDAIKEDIADDVKSSGGALEQSTLHRLLVEGGASWSVLATSETFGANADELAVLASLGALGARAGAPVIADAGIDLLGCASADALTTPSRWEALADDAGAFWRELRASPIARHVALVVPRILLRLPYGKKTDPIDAFPFEELPKDSGADPSWYRYASGAFGAAILLGKAFQSSGWDMTPGDELELDDLPALSYKEDGEQRLLPCAEWAVSESVATKILERGINPVVSYYNRNAVRFMRIQAIAEPASSLSGAWSSGE
ncbi:MAG TPA: type VI secretion system contractile sheath large subunit [Polyangiaceae bacterium]|nr:type VI secretion system contractile sheath large subunit [Polyangiaceae bacterium]